MIGLLKGLARNNIINSFSARSNLLTDAISDYIFDLVDSKISILKHIDLAHNNLTDITVLAIAKALENN